ncbi:hypothetical protein SprV_1002838000 [Sparganum proliferum]
MKAHTYMFVIREDTTRDMACSATLEGRSKGYRAHPLGADCVQSCPTVRDTGAATAFVDFLASFESIISSSSLTEEEQFTIRSSTAQALKNRKKFSTLSSDEIKTLKTLKQDEDIIILPTDKGGASTILNKTDYTDKMMSLLKGDSTYEPLAADPTTSQNSHIEKNTETPFGRSQATTPVGLRHVNRRTDQSLLRLRIDFDRVAESARRHHVGHVTSGVGVSPPRRHQFSVLRVFSPVSSFFLA